MSLDPACHAECLEFIRVAIAEAFRTTAHEIAAVLKEVCTEGHADRAQIWSALEPLQAPAVPRITSAAADHP